MKPARLKPADNIDPLPWMTAPATRAVIVALTTGGAEARFVGGCVRDTLLGRPVKDIDIATHLNPHEVMELLGAAEIHVIPTGIDHGTVTAVIGKEHFEITTLRRDVETFGRRARVAFTDDWAVDAARRDFTMNALFLDPDGTLYDPFGGIKDLKRGRVRFVGDARERITEDVLRLLRFFRFFAHYDKGRPDRKALAACRDLASELPSLSGERIGAEILRLLEAPDPATTLELMAAKGILGHILPDARAFGRVRALVAIEAKGIFGLVPDALRRLGAVIEADGSGAELAAETVAERVASRLRFSNFDKQRLKALVSPPPLLSRACAAVADGDDDATATACRRALYHHGVERFRDGVALHWAGEMAAGEITPEITPGITPEITPEMTKDAAAGYPAVLDIARHWVPVSLPVTGQDVVALGIDVGPEVGDHLRMIEAWWEANDYTPGRQACLEVLKRLVMGEGG